MKKAVGGAHVESRREPLRLRPNRPAHRPYRWPIIVLALLPAISFGLCAFIAFLHYPGTFTPIQNTLSELGNPDRNPDGSTIYRVGCVLGGSTSAAFFLCLSLWRRSGTQRRNRVLTLVQGLGLMAALAMILFAAYPYDELLSHRIVLGLLANSSLAAMVLSLFALWRKNRPQRLRTIVTIVASSAILLMYAIPQYHWAEWLPATLSQPYIWVLGVETATLSVLSRRAGDRSWGECVG
ncbi:MAG TPA: DUF998 domain-containing protein [Chloroflexota bacterium]|nr:DUF998 domain-containing protein [Chloroflexota bacterium]